jgi:peroxiredoxin
MTENSTIDIDMKALGACAVFTDESNVIQMRMLWQNQPAIFIFLRHFACIACRAHAAQIWSERERYEANGGKIIFVGNGQPHFMEKFREDLKLEGALLVTDPKRDTFQRVGFREGFFYVVRPASVVNAVKLATEGHRQVAYDKGAGTHWQLGGVLVVSKQGMPLYRYISESLGDFPEEKGLRFIQKNEGM